MSGAVAPSRTTESRRAPFKMDSDDLPVGRSSSPHHSAHSGPSRRPSYAPAEFDPSAPRYAPPLNRTAAGHAHPYHRTAAYGSPPGGAAAQPLRSEPDHLALPRMMDTASSTTSTGLYVMSRNHSDESRKSGASNGSQHHHIQSPDSDAAAARAGPSNSFSRAEARQQPRSDSPPRSPPNALSEPASRSRSPPRPRRTRVLMTRMQWTALTNLWDKTTFPATNEREALAQEIGLTPRQVQVWFQNQRQKRRREREMDGADTINMHHVGDMPRTAEAPGHWAASASVVGSSWSMHSAPAHLQSMPPHQGIVRPPPAPVGTGSSPGRPISDHGRPPMGVGHVPAMSHIMNPLQLSHGSSPLGGHGAHVPLPHPVPLHHPQSNPRHVHGPYHYPEERDSYTRLHPPGYPGGGGMPGIQALPHPPPPPEHYSPVDRWRCWSPGGGPGNADSHGPTRSRSRSFVSTGRPYPAPYSPPSPIADNLPPLAGRSQASPGAPGRGIIALNPPRSPPPSSSSRRMDLDRLGPAHVAFSSSSQTLSWPTTVMSHRGGGGSAVVGGPPSVRSLTGPTTSSNPFAAPSAAQRVSSLPPSLSALVLDRPLEMAGNEPPLLSPLDPNALKELVLEPEIMNSPSPTRPESGDRGPSPATGRNPPNPRDATSPTLPSLAHLLN